MPGKGTRHLPPKTKTQTTLESGNVFVHSFS